MRKLYSLLFSRQVMQLHLKTTTLNGISLFSTRLHIFQHYATVEIEQLRDCQIRITSVTGARQQVELFRCSDSLRAKLNARLTATPTKLLIHNCGTRDIHSINLFI